MNDQSTTDRQLLREFIQTRSDIAFAELVHRHVNWIYAVARRQVGESAADDLTQAVFLVLVQKADIAARQPVLSAWLFGVLRFAILRYRRDQKRRAQHERLAAQMPTTNQTQTDQVNLQILDELLIKLREKDRHAILVRFYEQRTLAEVGEVLGISEEAATKRVARAIDKLRSMLARRGISATPTILTTTLMQQLLTQAPPSTISVAIGVTHTKSTVTAIQLSKGAMRMMAIRHAGLITVSSLAICVATAGGLAGYTQCKSATKVAAAATPTPMQMVNFISAKHTFVAISRDNQHISGYSNTLGKWTPLQLDPDAAAALKGRTAANQLDGFICTDQITIVHLGSHVYAYSSTVGNWAAMPMDAGAQASLAHDDAIVGPNISENVAAMKVGNHIYAYSAATGTWDAITVDIDMDPKALWTMQDMAVINYGDHLANFSVFTGKWAKVDWGNGKS